MLEPHPIPLSEIGREGLPFPAARGLFFPWLVGGLELGPLISNVCANPAAALASSTQQAIPHDRLLNITSPGCGFETVRLTMRSDAYYNAL